MSAKNDLTIPLLPGRYYHIYNRGINRCNIFYQQENFRYFLMKYGEKLKSYFDTFGYALLDNHFHLFVRVKPIDVVLTKGAEDFTAVNETFYKDYVTPWVDRLKGSVTSDLTPDSDLTNFRNLLNLSQLSQIYGDAHETNPEFPEDLKEVDFRTQLSSWVVSERFRGFMLGYAKAINKQESRTGSLLQKGFRRKYIIGDTKDYKSVLTYIHHNPIHHFYTDNYKDYTWSSYNTYLTDKQTQLCRSESLEWFGSKEHFIDFGENYKKNKNYVDKWIINED